MYSVQQAIFNIFKNLFLILNYMSVIAAPMEAREGVRPPGAQVICETPEMCFREQSKAFSKNSKSN